VANPELAYNVVKLKQMQGVLDVRTYEQLGLDDLKEIRQHALVELDRFLYRIGNPKGKYVVYRDRLIVICLCQGAAQHFVDRTTGIKDIDVWFFFQEHRDVKIPDIKNMRYSVYVIFKNIGKKRVDFLKKGLRKDIIDTAKSTEPGEILSSYLRRANTHTSQSLSQKSVIGLYPDKVFGKAIWKI